MNVVLKNARRCLWLCAVWGGALQAAESFESDCVPAGWQASADGALAVSGERFKSGNRSLCWSWGKSGGSLTLAAPGGLGKMDKARSLAFWVYSEKPSERVLRLDFLHRGERVGGCWYNMNFKGWRPFGAPYGQLELASKRIDGIRLSVGKDDGAGRLFLDLVNFDCADKLLPDGQQPWVGKDDVLKTDTPQKYRYSSRDLAQNRPWLPKLVPADKLTRAELDGMAKIAGRTTKITWHAYTTAGVWPRSDAKILDDCRKQLKIKRGADGSVTGAPLISNQRWIKSKFNNPPDGVEVHELFNRLAQAYLFERNKGNQAKAAEMRRMYDDVCDHILDQGFAENSGNMGCRIIDPAAVFGLKKELAESGRLRDMIQAVLHCGLAISRSGVPFCIEDWRNTPQYDARNTDLYTHYTQLLLLCATLPDPAERAQHLYACRRMFQELFNPALGEPYAWDGTTHHHPQWHIAYCAGNSFRMLEMMSGTVFRLAPEVYQIAKRDFKLLAFAAGPSDTFPPNLPGYSGQPLGSKVVPIAAEAFAKLDSPDNKDGFDHDFASVALWYLDPAKNALAKEIAAKGIRPAKLSGHMTLNAASIALHRRGGWLVAIAGQNKFRRPGEGNGAYIASAFNHYVHHGSVYVVSTGNPPSPWDSGFSLEGWNSGLQPGATSYLGENEAQLQYRVGASSSAFGGGTSLDGDGIWGMELIRTNPRSADNMRFYKSAFCFDNRITLITTDIGRGESASAAERALGVGTTLWQNAIGSGGETEITRKGAGRFGAAPPPKPAPLDPALEPCWIDGRKITEFPYQAKLSGGQPHWLIDNKRTGYYVAAGNPPLEVVRRIQRWTYIGNQYFAKPGVAKRTKNPADYNPTEGNFSAAWFTHGAKPDFQECAYTLIPDATPEEMKAFAAAMSSPQTAPYLIRQKDAKAHALWDRASNATGYLIFTPAWSPFPGSRLLKVNRICSVMIRENGPNELLLSAASTDMDRYPAWGDGSIRLSGDIVLTLKGVWRIAEIGADTPADCAVAVKGGETVLTIPYRTFLPTKLKLVSGNAKP